jgi:Holliday junction resolvase RusA-like endonuclease
MKIIIPGIPIAQIRMRYSGRNGIGRIYDPREKEKKKLKNVIKNIFADNKHFINPHISFIFHMPIPRSIPKKFLSLYNSGLFKHPKKPDVDNFIKLYLDCLDGICFEGDQKVSLGDSLKVYHPEPKTIILINETSDKVCALDVRLETWLNLVV